MDGFVGALDQGTTSTRFIVFDRSGRVVAADQREHRQLYPRPGWVEHDPAEIWTRVRECVDGALSRAGLARADLAAVGITNQRETVVAWDRRTGEPVGNAIVWQDTRSDGIVRELARDGGPDRFRATTGLPLATYFSGPKIRWLLEHVAGARSLADGGDLLVGTVDSWCTWNLTGGPDGGLHLTDASNASRTQLMDLATLDWDDAILAELGIPRSILPAIRPSSEVYGTARGVLDGVPLAAALGDQQAALFGQACYAPGEAKNTYGTGCFLLLNTGERAVASTSGLLTTVAYRIGGGPPVYALEGSVAIAGALVGWLRDNLGLIASADEIEPLARSVDDAAGVVIVPAFSGLFAPYWRSDARGLIAGLTGYVTRAHLARAALESTAWQVRELVDAMARDSGVPLASLKVDGGMVRNSLLMQLQADILGVPVVRPVVTETTALGAAYAAGLAVGFWTSLDEVRANWAQDAAWGPSMPEAARERALATWRKAVARTLDWVDGSA